MLKMQTNGEGNGGSEEEKDEKSQGLRFESSIANDFERADKK